MNNELPLSSSQRVMMIPLYSLGSGFLGGKSLGVGSMSTVEGEIRHLSVCRRVTYNQSQEDQCKLKGFFSGNQGQGKPFQVLFPFPLPPIPNVFKPKRRNEVNMIARGILKVIMCFQMANETCCSRGKCGR